MQHILLAPPMIAIIFGGAKPQMDEQGTLRESETHQLTLIYLHMGRNDAPIIKSLTRTVFVLFCS